MTTIFEIPTLTFTADDYNKKDNEIVINLNDYRNLDNSINEYEQTHRRILPEINIISPTGKIGNFNYPTMDRWEIVYKGTNCNIRLTYK